MGPTLRRDGAPLSRETANAPQKNEKSLFAPVLILVCKIVPDGQADFQPEVVVD